MHVPKLLISKDLLKYKSSFKIINIDDSRTPLYTQNAAVNTRYQLRSIIVSKHSQNTVSVTSIGPQVCVKIVIKIKL